MTRQTITCVALEMTTVCDRACPECCANINRVASRKRDRSNYRRLDSESRFKEQMREAAGRQCQRCGKSEADNRRKLDVHRKTPSTEGGVYTLANVEVLCQSCHVSRERWNVI